MSTGILLPCQIFTCADLSGRPGVRDRRPAVPSRGRVRERAAAPDRSQRAVSAQFARPDGVGRYLEL